MQILDTLDIHETWYDQRLYAGQQWWTEILRRLDWCEGFVYLLSPDSVASEYCQKEFDLAQKSGRHLFPVLIQNDTLVPELLRHVQYVDLVNGLTPDSVKSLLNSIHLAERNNGKDNHHSLPVSAMPQAQIAPPPVNSATVIGEAATAMENGQFDRAVFLLKQARENKFRSKFINLDALLQEAEAALERQGYLREAEREYKQIVELVKRSPTFKLGCEAFIAFQKDYPDYDPDNIAALCNQPQATPVRRASPSVHFKPEFTLPLLDWCEVQPGMVSVDTAPANSAPKWESHFVDVFKIAKYPITNAQYQAFLKDVHGYYDPQWWNFSPQAKEWRKRNPHPQPPHFKGDERPRETTTWFEAMAFCRWLSDKMEQKILLPTESQWQRAAQGDDHRAYPWGAEFDLELCNTRESGIKMTTLVMRYPEGVSPTGAYDMSGNVWEWCLNGNLSTDNNDDVTATMDRAVRGGSFIGGCERARTTFRFYLNPASLYASIGFRVALFDFE
jgi:formylglycine-generating enzyme required for sulfatase activity